MPDTRNKIAEDQAEAEEASTEDAARNDEAHTKLQEAILQVPGLASNNARALAAALCAAGVVDDDMMREITTEEIQEVMSTMAAFKDGKYPKFLPKNIGIKIRAGAASGSPPCKSPSSSRLTATSQHAATSAAVAINAIRPTARLAQDTDTSRPGLAKSEDFTYLHLKPYSPYDPELMQVYEAVKTQWGLAKEAAEQLGSDTDPLVKQSLSHYLVQNMGLQTYNTYVKPHLTKEEREDPILIIWQLLSEARKVSEIDLSRRYTALLQPTKATNIAGLTALYQQQIDEETELRLHDFVTDKKAQPLKEAFLELGSNYPVLLTKIEIAWQGAKDNPPAALNLVKAEIVSFFSTQQEGPLAVGGYTQGPLAVGGYTPAGRPKPAPHAPGPPARMLPTGRVMGSNASDQVCRQFQSRGSCTYGEKCKFSHDPGAVAMLVDNEEDQEEDCVIDMFQQSTMAVAEPKIAMQVMGISGFDSE